MSNSTSSGVTSNSTASGVMSASGGASINIVPDQFRAIPRALYEAFGATEQKLGLHGESRCYEHDPVSGLWRLWWGAVHNQVAIFAPRFHAEWLDSSLESVEIACSTDKHPFPQKGKLERTLKPTYTSWIDKVNNDFYKNLERWMVFYPHVHHAYVIVDHHDHNTKQFLQMNPNFAEKIDLWQYDEIGVRDFMLHNLQPTLVDVVPPGVLPPHVHPSKSDQLWQIPHGDPLVRHHGWDVGTVVKLTRSHAVSGACVDYAVISDGSS